MKVTAKQVKRLRDKTGAGILEVKRALEKAKGDEKKAMQALKEKGLEKLKKRALKQANEGQVFAYVHAGGRIASLVKIVCETDFVANSTEFQKLGKELAMQVASMEPKGIKDLLGQAYIRDAKKKIKDLVEEMAVRVKEKIEIEEIARLNI